MAVIPDLVFRQWSGNSIVAFPAADGEAYALRSVDPAGEWGHVVFGGTFSTPAMQGTSAYEGRLVQDSGRFDGTAPIIMLVAFNVPAELQAEVDRWYFEEHVPLLMRARGWMRARRYEVTRVADGSPPFTSLAFHHLTDLSVLDSEERAFARSTEWRARLEHEGTWFGQAGRWVYACE
jgi:hypothetical protein